VIGKLHKAVSKSVKTVRGGYGGNYLWERKDLSLEEKSDKFMLIY